MPGQPEWEFDPRRAAIAAERMARAGATAVAPRGLDRPGVRELLVDDVAQEIARLSGRARLTDARERALHDACAALLGPAAGAAACAAAASAARLGYLSRRVEFDRFAWARVPDLGLMRRLGELPDARRTDRSGAYPGIARLACRVACDEPPVLGDGEWGMSWRVPGLGADTRARLADRLLADLAAGGPERAQAPPAMDSLRRAWKVGFFFRVLEELAVISAARSARVLPPRLARLARRRAPRLPPYALDAQDGIL